MKKIYHLSTCSTCQRIIKDLQPLVDFELQDIKTQPITNDQLEQMHSLSNSYEALFSKRAVLYRERNLKEQEALVAKGASKTMKSKHLEGKAVDLMAYIDGRASWELNVYDEIADAMKEASKETEVDLRWGACWTTNSLRESDLSCDALMMQYVDIRRSQGRRPVIDAPHFELT